MKAVFGHRPAMLGAVMPLALATGMLISTSVLAQGVYRIVGPDGKVSYSDQPPASNAPSSGPAKAAGASAAAPASSAGGYMPQELKQAMGRYPVVFYAGKDCAPCDSGRNYLNSRGIPYTEKTVNSNDDVAALKRLSSATSLPMLAVGGQHIKGYSEVEWSQYLDAAGYPKKPALPASYRRPAPTPMVEAKAADAAAPANGSKRPAKASEVEAPAEVPVTAPVTNPGGIRF